MVILQMRSVPTWPLKSRSIIWHHTWGGLLRFISLPYRSTKTSTLMSLSYDASPVWGSFFCLLTDGFPCRVVPNMDNKQYSLGNSPLPFSVSNVASVEVDIGIGWRVDVGSAGTSRFCSPSWVLFLIFALGSIVPFGHPYSILKPKHPSKVWL